MCILLKHDVRVKFFNSNCLEIGVEAVEKDLQYGKLQYDTTMVSIEKSRDELFTSGIASTGVYVIKARCLGEISDSSCIYMGVEAVEMDW